MVRDSRVRRRGPPAVYTAIISFSRAILRGLRNPEYRALAVATLVVVVGGTAFYHYYEGWTWTDSAYFTVVALTTVGFGDFAPSTEFSRGVTIGFLFFGVTLLGTFISLVFRGTQEHRRARSAADSQTPPDD
jgi:hypothetical protein